MREINTINERIIQIIDEDCGGNRSEFARRLEITPTYAAQLYKGERIPGDRIISSISREFNVRREWLETGEEPMKLPEPEHGMEVIDQLLENEADPVVRRVKRWMAGYFRLSPERRKIAAALLDEIERLQDEK